jgi:hypothetical protein
MMVTIAWNPLGFHLVESFPKGRTFNAEYYPVHILAALIPLRHEADGRKLVLHADNAKTHMAQKCRAFCAENGLRLAMHSSYSPDLTPSDFVLFGYVKHCLQGMAFSSHRELRAAIERIVSEIPIMTLHAIFELWMERLEWVFDNNDDYHP